MADSLRSAADHHRGPSGNGPPVSDDTIRRDPAPGGRWGELRDLLLGPEHQRLDDVERRLADHDVTAETVGEVLPDAVRHRARDKALGAALGPVVGEAIGASVRRDPQPVVDAIFPVIGPAIRKAIATAFADLVQSLNVSLEHAFTIRGLRWRLEALRTGRSFGEVVLSHSLAYRTEQVFLIHRESGLLVRHVTAPGITALSPEMVAGMLTAITQFAQDSFQVSRQEGLDAFALGDLAVWVEQGPAVTLAAVVRGHAPAGFRATLQEAVEGVQRAHADALEAFGRDGRTFEVRDDLLEPCLVVQRADAARRVRPWRLVVAGALVMAAFATCAVPRYLQSRRVDRWVTRLRSEPGIVVASVGRSGGRATVSGLRDPLAVDPGSLLATFGLDTAAVSGHWEPYVALRPAFVARRVTAALAPPPGVRLEMRGDTLAALGVAPAAWIDRARALAPAVAGGGALDFGALADSVELSLRARGEAIGEFTVQFARGEAYPAAGPALDSLVEATRAFVRDAMSSGRTVRIEVRTATDSLGTDAVNRVLRDARARALRDLLASRGVPSEVLEALPDSLRGARQGYLRVQFPSRTP